MIMKETTLPWSDARVRASENLNPLIATVLGPEYSRYLPQHVTLFADPEVPDSEIGLFLGNMCDFLLPEMSIRSARAWRLTRESGLSADEVELFLTGHTGIQRWGLYLSRDGGLGMSGGVDWRKNKGVVPCSSMRNHGVGWLRTGGGSEVWLATARKPNEKWDMESDIGHESAHAAFAPVPLFVQPAEDPESASLADVTSAGAMRPAQIARMLYLYSELAVVALRGETRPTYTRLPVTDPEELYALLSIGEQVFPGVGFDEARSSCSRVLARFDPSESDAVFALVAPLIRILPGLLILVEAFAPPTIDELRNMAAEPAACLTR